MLSFVGVEVSKGKTEPFILHLEAKDAATAQVWMEAITYLLQSGGRDVAHVVENGEEGEEGGGETGAPSVGEVADEKNKSEKKKKKKKDRGKRLSVAPAKKSADPFDLLGGFLFCLRL